jgi:hypothetical protein
MDDDGRLVLAARVLEERDGQVRHVTAEEAVSLGQAGRPAGADLTTALGRRVAASLLESGAGPMLERMRQPFA